VEDRRTSDDTQTGKAPEPVEGLTAPRTLSLERFLIRTRADAAMQSAWRLSVACDEGQGAIVLVEVSPDETFYRGDGVFLGWAQDRLKAAYRALLPKSDEPTFEMHQLG
jgi:hypothetical protein